MDDFLGSGGVVEVEVPSSLQITVSYPVENNKKVGYQTTISGSCSPAGKSIEITGDATGVGICGLAGTWSSTIDFSGAAIGAVTANVRMVDGSNSSGTIAKTFEKDNTDCDLAAARAGTFASDVSPYFICTPVQFDNIRTQMTSDFVIKNELDFQSSPFNQINGNFEGNINGNGFSIENMLVNLPSSSEVGIFQYFRNGASFIDASFETFL